MKNHPKEPTHGLVLFRKTGREFVCPRCQLLGTIKQTSQGFVVHREPGDKTPVVTLMVYWCEKCKSLYAREEK